VARILLPAHHHDDQARATASLIAIGVTLLASSCTAAYYSALQTVGIEKRDILADRVEKARDSQTAAKEQFTTALDRYRSVVNVEGGDLEEILRHNLNARAIGSLEPELAAIERATAALIEEMERSIAEASRFIEQLA
jgi:hypothetical protein